MVAVNQVVPQLFLRTAADHFELHRKKGFEFPCNGFFGIAGRFIWLHIISVAFRLLSLPGEEEAVSVPFSPIH
jgi:hypothetical protein